MKKQIITILTISLAFTALMCSCSAPTQKIGPLDRYKVDTEKGTKVEGIYAKLYNSIVDKSCVILTKNLTAEQVAQATESITTAYQKYDNYAYNYAHLVSNPFRNELEQKLINFTDHIDYQLDQNNYSEQSPFVRMGE